MSEESNQPTKQSNKILISIILTIMATILDTHTVGLPTGVNTIQIVLKRLKLHDDG